MKNILITGATGFVGGNLVERLLEDKDNRIVGLVESRFRETFDSMVDGYRDKYPDIESRLHMVEGDITRPDLGMGKNLEILKNEVNTVYHLAAIYLLEVGKDIAEKVNVQGTKNITDNLKQFKNLNDYNYISTCYISGKRKGRIYENELDMGQDFNNFYESTKFKAELYVKKNMKSIPTRIFRPSIIVGDSKSGETISFNGLYFSFDGIKRNFLGWPALLALPGDGNSKVNFVPIDYVIDAMACIAKNPTSIGGTYQLADPNPLSANDIIEECCEYFDRKKPLLGHLPHFLAKLSFEKLGFDKLLKIQKELIAYMNSQTEYDTSNTDRFVRKEWIECPSLRNYLPTIAKYWEENS